MRVSRNMQYVGLALLAVITLGLTAIAMASTPGSSPEERAEWERQAASNRASQQAREQAAEEAETHVAFLGDSYTVGARASDESNRWTSLVADKYGWVGHNFGVSDTGYLVSGSHENGNPYAARIPEIAELEPDMVVVSGGRNDLYSPTGEVLPAIKETFAKLRGALPDAKIVAVSPFWGASEPVPTQLEVFAEQVKESVKSVGGEYVDVGHPILGHPGWMADDGVHPTDPGYKAIAEAFIDAYNP